MAEERREGRGGGSYCRSVNPILTRGQILPTLLLLEWTLQIFEQFGGSSGDFQNVLKISFSRFFFVGRPRKGKTLLQDGLDWLCYLTGRSKKPSGKFNFWLISAKLKIIFIVLHHSENILFTVRNHFFQEFQD